MEKGNLSGSPRFVDFGRNLPRQTGHRVFSMPYNICLCTPYVGLGVWWARTSPSEPTLWQGRVSTSRSPRIQTLQFLHASHPQHLRGSWQSTFGTDEKQLASLSRLLGGLSFVYLLETAMSKVCRKVPSYVSSEGFGLP